MIPLTVELLLALLTSLAFWAATRRRSPLPIFGAGLRAMLLRPEYRRPLALVVAIIILDIIQSQLDGAITAALGYDMTPWIHRLEGDSAAVFQRLEWPPATWAFGFVYIVILPALIAAPAVLAAAEDDLPAYRAGLRGFAWNYWIGLPFYFFFPVKEMWAGNPQHVRLLMDDLSPAIMEAYRANSAIDNCFPSLHTSLALTAALVASRVGPRSTARFLWPAAVAVVASTLYLGIHWASDVLAGCILAVIASRLAVRGLSSPAEDYLSSSGSRVPPPAGA